MATSTVNVFPVESSKDRRKFLELPWKIYRDDPNWIPPLRTNQEELVGYKPHPFYDRAEIQTFLAERDGEICGRIAAIVNHAHNEQHKEEIGSFGFFECINDHEVAKALFDRVKEHHAANNLHRIRGPLNPSMNYECGLLVEGFDKPPTFMMTYNHAYYPELVEANGFEKVQDLLSFVGRIEMLGTFDKKIETVLWGAIERFNLKLRCMDRKRFKQDLKTFIEMFNLTQGNNWGHVPLSDAEADHLASGLRHLIVPELTSVAEVDGKAIGVAFGMLDYNPRIKKIDGKLFPFGFIRLLWNRRKIKKVRLISTYVLPEYQRWGVGLVLLARLIPRGVKMGIEEGEASWVLETNKLSRGSLERGGAIRDKLFRLYDYSSASEPG